MPSQIADDLAYASIAEVAALIRDRSVSPVELVQSAYDRIARRNPSVNAFVYQRADYAVERAREVERALLAGADPGPLAGIPTAIKDLVDSRPGWVSTLGGIRALKDNVVDGYCNFAWRMEHAGAIPLGKTNSPTMGFRGTCDNLLWGPTRNPFDLTRNSGGSSGGAAAAVADGLLAFAEGTDGGGSIRIPAAWCNLFGFKASSGRVARLQRPQAFPPTSLFTFEGVVTRSVADTALVFDALCGHDPRDPNSLPDAVDWQAALRGSVRGWRVAYSPDFGVFPVHPEVRALVAEAARAFETAGAHVEEVKIDLRHDPVELGDLWCALMVTSSVVQVERLRRRGIDLLGKHRADMPLELLHWIEQAQRFSVFDMAEQQVVRTEVYDAIDAIFRDYDLLLTPTLACPPVENASDGNTLGPERINGTSVERSIGWCLTFPLNFTGHPAASVPAGLTAAGLPVGMQVIGPKYAEAAVLTASAVFEQVRPWQRHYQIPRDRPV